MTALPSKSCLRRKDGWLAQPVCASYVLTMSDTRTGQIYLSGRPSRRPLLASLREQQLRLFVRRTIARKALPEGHHRLSLSHSLCLVQKLLWNPSLLLVLSLPLHLLPRSPFLQDHLRLRARLRGLSVHPLLPPLSPHGSTLGAQYLPSAHQVALCRTVAHACPSRTSLHQLLLSSAS